MFSSVAQSCPTLCDPMDCSTPGFPVHPQCLELAQTHVHWLGDAIQPSVVPFSSCPQPFPASGVFSNELVLRIRWPKYWSFSISPSNEYSGLISFRMDWLDLLAVQGTLKSLLQHHSHINNIITIKATFPINEWYQAEFNVAILWIFFLYTAKIFFWKCNIFKLNIVDLKCVCFRGPESIQLYTCIYIYIQIIFPYRLLKNIKYSSLCYTVCPCWLFYIW